MRVLYLGPPSPILSFLRATESCVDVWVASLPDEQGFARTRGYDAYVSNGYRHIIAADHIAWCASRSMLLLNCHISFLPWNRGASPNAWAWYENAPHGITIHGLDAGVDTGPIYTQRDLRFGRGETLTTSYARLQAEMYAMFSEKWPALRRGDICPGSQGCLGTYHSKADTERVITPLLTQGWDTPVSILQEAGRKARKESE